MKFSTGQLAKALALISRDQPVARYWVGFSGGLDSTVLLHAMQRLHLPQALVAVHVNHGLHPDAARWVAHCRRVCHDWNIRLEVVEVDARAAPGESPEAAARQARYGVFQKLLSPGDCLLTAQHEDDQAETLLLQLLRGGGPAGLAAMPPVAGLAAGRLGRPLLAFGREDLHAYAEAESLRWIEDGSNADPGFDRNYLRHRVLPLLKARWPGYAKTLARAARHQAEAAALLAQTAEADLAAARGDDPGALSVARLRAFSGVRRRNIIRHWLKRQAGILPTEAVLDQIGMILTAAPDRRPEVRWANTEVRRYRDGLFVMPSVAVSDPGREYHWPPGVALPLPELGITLDRLELESRGIVLPAAALRVRFRRGGERIRLPGRGHSHSLKKLLQERGVPPWLRERLPLVYEGEGEGERLVAVLGLQPPIVADGISRAET
jgi:tRNA(Ile)-lysidine synthase